MIVSEFEKAYAQIAALWRQEFLVDKPKTPAKFARYTRQKETAEASAAKQREEQGFNLVQKKQLQYYVDEAIQPIAAVQQQQQSQVQELQKDRDSLALIAQQNSTMMQKFLPLLDKWSAQPPKIAWQTAPVSGPSQGPTPLQTVHDSCDGSQAS